MDLKGLPLRPPQGPRGVTVLLKAPLAWVALPLAEDRVAKRKAWGVGEAAGASWWVPGALWSPDSPLLPFPSSDPAHTFAVNSFYLKYLM